jgi:hypothetical protein
MQMGSSHSCAYSSPTGRVPELPNECLLLILQHCPGTTLKNARCASKTFASLAEPLLWRDLRLVPNLDALGSIKQLVKHSNIACYVQNLIYDTSWEHVIDEFRSKAEKPNLRAKNSPAPGKERYSCSKVLLHAVRNRIKSGEDAAAEVACLTPLLLALPNLRELTIKESITNFEPTANMPFFYRRVCRDAALLPSEIKGSAAVTPLGSNASHTRNFLLAAYSTGHKYHYIDLEAVSWHTFFRPPLDVNQGTQTLDFKVRQILFSGLKQLDISFKGSPSRDAESNLVPLRDLLKSCERLEGLSLSFSSLVNRRYANDHRSFSFLAPLLWSSHDNRPLLPRLKDLFLSSLFCTPKDLVQLLVMHSSTLKHVSLSDISLLRNELSDSRGCWVQVMKDMKTLLRLQTVYFSGWLSNGGRQVWNVSQDAAESDRLRPRVIRYLLDDNVQVCPLDHVAVRPDAEDVEKPVHGWSEGDWTWTMISASTRTRDQTLSGSQMFSKTVPLDSDGWALANPHFWKTPYQKTPKAYKISTVPKGSKKSSSNLSDPWSDWGASSSWMDVDWSVAKEWTVSKGSQSSDQWDVVDVGDSNSFGFPPVPLPGTPSISQSSASSAGSSNGNSPSNAELFFSTTQNSVPPSELSHHITVSAQDGWNAVPKWASPWTLEQPQTAKQPNGTAHTWITPSTQHSFGSPPTPNMVSPHVQPNGQMYLNYSNGTNGTTYSNGINGTNGMSYSTGTNGTSHPNATNGVHYLIPENGTSGKPNPAWQQQSYQEMQYKIAAAQQKQMKQMQSMAQKEPMVATEMVHTSTTPNEWSGNMTGLPVQNGW